MGDDILRVLIASDMHLGYAEKDPIRGEDSFNTFEELLVKANELKVDFILFAGDLFHDNKPSRRTVQKCMELLRDHVFGERAVRFDVVSDSNTTFHDKYRQVNFEDPNMNVQLPIFAIHGNHDDPAGDGGLAALDVVSTANLVNYFGRAHDVSAVTLHPILIEKGQTKLALYGLGHIRDERLHRMFERKEVRVARPSVDADKWFNLLAIHQNRIERGAGVDKKGYVKESQLPSCMDIVIWGHEHKCEIGSGAGNEAADNQFVVLQPGSTVATSLVEGEAEPKHLGLLELLGQKWKFTPILLETVRPFIIKDVILAEHADEYDFSDEQTLTTFLEDQVTIALAEVKERYPITPTTKAAENRLKYPLVRLRVDYTGFSTINPLRFGQRFVDSVANPTDILMFTRKPRKRVPAANDTEKVEAEYQGGEPDDARTQIQSFVAEFLQKGSKEQLRLLSEDDLNTAVFDEYVGKDNKSAIANAVEEKVRKAREMLRAARARGGYDATADQKAKESFIDNVLAQQPKLKAAVPQATENSKTIAATQKGRTSSARTSRAADEDSDDLDFGSNDDDERPPSKTSGSRSAGALGRGRGGLGGGRGRSACGGKQARLDVRGGGLEVDRGNGDKGSSSGAVAKKRAAAGRKRPAVDKDDDVKSNSDSADEVASIAPSSKRSFAGKRRMK